MHHNQPTKPFPDETWARSQPNGLSKLNGLFSDLMKAVGHAMSRVYCLLCFEIELQMSEPSMSMFVWRNSFQSSSLLYAPWLCLLEIPVILLFSFYRYVEVSLDSKF